MLKKSLNKVKILDMSLSSTSVKQVLREARMKALLFERGGFGFEPLVITTPNPEIVLKAIRNRKLYSFIETSDFAVPDGVGLVLADFFLKLKCPRVPFSFLILPFQWFYTVVLYLLGKRSIFSLDLIKGRDLFERLVFLANKKGWKVVFLGDGERSAQKAADVLQKNYKKVKIFPFVGPSLNKQGQPIDNENKKVEIEILESINRIRPHFLFVAFGAPKQELWLGRNLSKLEIGLAMTVGGSFDYVSGKVKKPPEFLEKFGLEWFWRLIIQPKRVGRIFNAVVIFPLKLILWKLKKGY